MKKSILIILVSVIAFSCNTNTKKSSFFKEHESLEKQRIYILSEDYLYELNLLDSVHDYYNETILTLTQKNINEEEEEIVEVYDDYHSNNSLLRGGGPILIILLMGRRKYLIIGLLGESMEKMHL